MAYVLQNEKPMTRRYRYQADAALLIEYQALFPRLHQLQPELKLMVAILEDVLRDFHEHVLGCAEWEKNSFKEAEDWILAEESHWLFSFESTCLHLDIDCQCLRRRLMAWKSTVLRDQPRAPRDNFSSRNNLSIRNRLE